MNERVIFDAALEIADPQARRAFIEKACAEKSGMLAAVEALLKSHDEAGSFLNVPVIEHKRSDPVGSGQPGNMFDKTHITPAGTPSDGDSDDESQLDLSFLQPSSKPGSIGLLGHYEVLQVLGQGGFGVVFKAFDEKLHRLVAIKVMNAQMAATSPPRKRFLREARAAAAIRHENIVQVYSVEEQPLPYLVMEFIDGPTLKQKLDGNGPLETTEVLHIARQIASGLAAAQAMGLIHRDIKPANILLEQGAEQRVKISDFGLARAADDASLTRTGVISGTPMYMAPEQATGQSLDHRADLFSLGSVLYQMACGRPPFRAATTVAVLRRVVEDTPRPLQEILPEVPDWLVAIVTKLHAKNPDDRFQTAKEVADLLARCQSELQLTGKVTPLRSPHESSPHAPREESQTSSDANRENDLASPTTPAARSANFTRSVKATLDSVRPESSAPAPPKLRLKHVLVALLVAVLAGPTLGVILKPHINRWLWPPIPMLAVTEIATGLRFDGKDDFVKVGPIDLSSPQYTLEAFVTSAKDGDNGVIALLKNVEKEPERMYLYDGHPGQERQSGAGIIGQRPYQSVSAPLPSGTREHRALVFDGSAMHYYVNGIWQGKRDCTAHKGLMWEMRELYIGCKAIETEFFRGQIDQLRLSKIARYNNNFTVASKLTSDDSTLALYNFDEGHGDVLNDSSGHGHHGKIVGATWASPNSSSSSLAPVESISTTNPDRRAAEWVLSIGGTIRIKESGQERRFGSADELPKGPYQFTGVELNLNPKVSDTLLVHLQDCKNLTVLDLNYTTVSGVGLAYLGDCKNFTVLQLAGTQVSDAELARFQNCKNLTHLDLNSTKVSDEGLAHFQNCPNLTNLGLSQTPVSNAGLAHLKACKNLTAIDLNGTKVSDEGLAALFKDCPNLTVLALNSTKVSDLGLAHIKVCKSLWVLGLAGAPVSDAGLAHLADCPKLASLNVKMTKVTEAGVKKLSAALPGCKIEWDGGVIEPTVSPDRRAAEYVLSIGGAIQVNGAPTRLTKASELPNEAFRLTYVDLLYNQKVTAEGLSIFQGCKNLTGLFVAATPINDDGLAHFKECKGLTVLNLDITQVTDAGVEHFKGCDKLIMLGLTSTKVTEVGLAHFKNCKDLRHLSLGGMQVTDQRLAIFKDCENLEWLHVNHSLVSDAGLAELNGCKKLSVINLTETQVTDEALAILKDLKNLENLQLNGTQVTNTGLAHLKDSQRLFEIGLAGTKVTEVGLAHLKECQRLTQLGLDQTAISDDSVEVLRELFRLRWIFLKGTKVTETGVKKLSAALPGCKIEWDGGVIDGGQK